ncbi:MAG: hypothetical protein ACRCX2_22710 [Paraclostridium sp.]
MFLILDEKELSKAGVSEDQIKKWKSRDNKVAIGAIDRELFYETSEKYFEYENGSYDTQTAKNFVNYLIKNNSLEFEWRQLVDCAIGELNYRVQTCDVGTKFIKEYNDLIKLFKEALDDENLKYAKEELYE